MVTEVTSVRQLFTRLLELLVGQWQPSAAVAAARVALGIIVPTFIVAYAIRCVLTGNATIIAKEGVREVTGLSAVAIGLAYAAAGLFLYVHVCWEYNPRLAGLRDFARQLLLVVIAASLAATFALALV